MSTTVVGGASSDMSLMHSLRTIANMCLIIRGLAKHVYETCLYCNGMLVYVP